VSQGIDPTLPAVTFALFAYNQEAYVAEAVRSAFAQDYGSLEIVISDDCSTDGTMEVIENEVANYRGNHSVVVRRNPRNLGTLRHVAEVASIARGELLVLAAGDDVSKAERTRVLVSEWQKTHAFALCSRYDRMSEAGELIELSVEAAVHTSHRIQDYFVPDGTPVSIVHGCTSAYDKSLFEHLHLTDEDYILSEDGAMSVLINLIGAKVAYLEESLVKYRESSSSLTNAIGNVGQSVAAIARDEARIVWFARAQANRCRLFLRMSENLASTSVRRFREDEVLRDLAKLELRGAWADMNFAERASGIIRMRSMLELRWALPRLFGNAPFFRVKWLYGWAKRQLSPLGANRHG
jgi:hypothetical protein